MRKLHIIPRHSLLRLTRPFCSFGMTSLSVRSYSTGIYRVLGLKEEEVTKVQTGGPDGDLGSNEILLSKDKTIAYVVHRLSFRAIQHLTLAFRVASLTAVEPSTTLLDSTARSSSVSPRLGR